MLGLYTSECHHPAGGAGRDGLGAGAGGGGFGGGGKLQRDAPQLISERPLFFSAEGGVPAQKRKAFFPPWRTLGRNVDTHRRRSGVPFKLDQQKKAPWCPVATELLSHKRPTCCVVHGVHVFAGSQDATALFGVGKIELSGLQCVSSCLFVPSLSLTYILKRPTAGR